MTQVTGAQRFLPKGRFADRGRRSPAARLEIRLVSEAGLFLDFLPLLFFRNCRLTEFVTERHIVQRKRE